MKFIMILCFICFSSLILVGAPCTPTLKTTIDTKWASLATKLGKATTDHTFVTKLAGCKRDYLNGSIYTSPITNTFIVEGAIRDKYNSLKGIEGFLGYPLTDESKTPDTIGRYNHFQGGSIYWRPCVGSYEIHGLIKDKWAAMGYETSILGYPKSDELTMPDGVGRYTLFQNGQILYHPTHGTFPMISLITRLWNDKGGAAKMGYPVEPMKCALTANGHECTQKFSSGKLLSNIQETNVDLRKEIKRRGIEVRHQGPRPTCSVHAMTFIIEYLYTSMCGNYWNNLSEEYLNHMTNVASNRTDDGDFFNYIHKGFTTYGMIKEEVLPYKKDWVYNFNDVAILPFAINDGKRFITDAPQIKGRFIKEWSNTNPGLTDSQFSEIINYLRRDIPVALGRDHSTVAVGFQYDNNYPGGGYFIIRNSYGVETDDQGYFKDDFENVKETVFDAFVYERKI